MKYIVQLIKMRVVRKMLRSILVGTATQTRSVRGSYYRKNGSPQTVIASSSAELNKHPQVDSRVLEANFF